MSSQRVFCAIGLVALLLISGCGEPTTPVAWSNQPPSGGQVTQAPKFEVGELWIYNLKNYAGSGNDYEYTFEIKSVNQNGTVDVEYKNYETNKSSMQVWDKNHQRIGFRQKNGSINKTGNRGEYSFPLWVGKRWTKEFRTSSTGGATNTYKRTYVVKGMELVDTPAGSFDAYKIWFSTQVVGASNAYYVGHFWYAPEVKMNVKMKREHFEWYLTNYGYR